MSENVNPWSDTPEEKEALAARNDSFGNVVSFKALAGDNFLRIRGNYKFYKDHWFNKIKRTAVCPGKECPVCSHPDRQKYLDQANALRKSGKEAEALDLFRKVFKTYDPSDKYAVNIIDRADGKIKVWKFSRKMKEDITKIIDEFGDPNTYDLKLVREGVGLKTKYSVTATRRTQPLTPAELELKLVPLGVIFKATPIDRIKAYLRGEIPARKTAAVASREEGAPTSEQAEPQNFTAGPAAGIEEPDLNTDDDDALDGLSGF